jgi:hypothetical protein
LAVSDIALKQPLPSEVSKDVMAYVGCIAGAILIEDYRQGLVEAGFSQVMIVDSGADLNAYAKVENQQGCCSPAISEAQAETPATVLSGSGSYSCCTPAPITQLESSCCTPAPYAETESELHNNLRDLLSRYNVNDYAASVRVFAVKPL